MPVLKEKANVKAVMTRPTMKEFIPAPGGAFWSSPRAMIVMTRKTVPTNSLKKAVAVPT